MSGRARLAAVLCAVVGVAGALPAVAQARGCITTLPVTHSFKSNYSESYRSKKMVVKVKSLGDWIKRTKAEIYTFGGDLIAKSKIYKRGFNTTRRLKMRLKYGNMQSGHYTLVVTGEPNRNRSCGPKKYIQVVNFDNCPKSLPIDFPNAPAGNASDYGRWLSIYLRPRSGVMRNVVAELYDAGGNFFGRAKVKALFGTAKLDIQLRHRLTDGVYSVLVDARGGLPRACGNKDAKKVLTFGGQSTGGQTGGGSDGGGTDGGGTDGGGSDGGGDDDDWFSGGDDEEEDTDWGVVDESDDSDGW